MAADARECAALNWAERLTTLPDAHAEEEDYAALKEHFSDQEISDLTFTIAVINAWNRLGVGMQMPVARRRSGGRTRADGEKMVACPLSKPPSEYPHPAMWIRHAGSCPTFSCLRVMRHARLASRRTDPFTGFRPRSSAPSSASQMHPLTIRFRQT
jgi:hypothetical protein